MTITDWSTDIALLALVFLQLRSRKLGIVQMALPIALVSLAVWNYFTGWPATSNGRLLIIAGAVIGTGLGIIVGALTRVRNNGGVPFAQATTAAAAVWILGMGTRLVFQLWAHGSTGAANLASFSLQHRIDQSAWVDALLFMAVAQVLARTAILYGRSRSVRREPANAR